MIVAATYCPFCGSRSIAVEENHDVKIGDGYHSESIMKCKSCKAVCESTEEWYTKENYEQEQESDEVFNELIKALESLF